MLCEFESSEADLLIIADDLTGACDAVAPFAYNGEVPVVRGLPLPTGTLPRVAAVATDTRGVSATEAARYVEQVIKQRGSLGQSRVIKKIDSTMKGHPGAEIAAAVQACCAAAALVCPANPSQGRTVLDGHLLTQGAGPAVDLVARLRQETSLPIRLFSLDDMMEMELAQAAPTLPHVAAPEIWLFDALTQYDLDRVVRIRGRLGGITIEAGSAGLTRAIALSLHRRRNDADYEPFKLPLPLIVVAGSTNPVTSAQLEHLSGTTGVVVEDLGNTNQIDRALAEGSCRIFRMNPYQVDPSLFTGLARAMAPYERGTFMLTGGDTATAFCEAAGIDHLWVQGEIADGIPLAVARDHPLHCWQLITKAGGFGTPTSLSSIFNRCHPAPALPEVSK